MFSTLWYDYLCAPPPPTEHEELHMHIEKIGDIIKRLDANIARVMDKIDGHNTVITSDAGSHRVDVALAHKTECERLLTLLNKNRTTYASLYTSLYEELQEPEIQEDFLRLLQAMQDNRAEYSDPEKLRQVTDKMNLVRQSGKQYRTVVDDFVVGSEEQREETEHVARLVASLETLPSMGRQ